MLDRSGAATPGSRRQLSAAVDVDEAVDAFWCHHRRHGEPLRSSVARLAEIALAADRDMAAKGTRILFDRIIEPLCDAFTEQDAATYQRAFAQIILAACGRHECRALRRILAAERVRSEKDLLERAAACRMPGRALPTDAQRERIRKVVVLSRLTVGADVAITSIVLRRMEELFPKARVCFVGTRTAGELARCFPGVEHAEIGYRRGDHLADRLNAWPAVRSAVTGVCAGTAADAQVVVDPDSRLTQLGLLPPAQVDGYYHFPSRSYAAADPSPLSVLVARWLDEAFGLGCDSLPSLRLPREDAAWGRALRDAIGGSGPLVCVSFGIGGNDRKRAGTRFELELLEWLVGRGCRVLLARGVGHAEVEQAYRLGRALEQRGISVLNLPRGRSLAALADRSAAVVTWEGDIAAFLAAVSCADLYVGYDSAGQHIAAALGVPALSLFIRSAGRRHAERWAPRGSAPVRVVCSASPADPAVLFDAARAAFDQLAPGGHRSDAAASARL